MVVMVILILIIYMTFLYRLQIGATSWTAMVVLWSATKSVIT